MFLYGGKLGQGDLRIMATPSIKSTRPYTLTAYRLAGVRCCRPLVLMVSAAVAPWVLA